MSFPSRERGLKLTTRIRDGALQKSFPSRERGLKLVTILAHIVGGRVVPLAGTWIETMIRLGIQ